MSLGGDGLDDATFGNAAGAALPSFFSTDASEAEADALLAHMRDVDLISSEPLSSFFSAEVDDKAKGSVFGSKSQGVCCLDTYIIGCPLSCIKALILLQLKSNSTTRRISPS